MLFCLWLLSINFHQLRCRVSFSFHLFVISCGSGTGCVTSLAIVWTPCAFLPVGFHLQKIVVCLSLPGTVTLYSRYTCMFGLSAPFTQLISYLIHISGSIKYLSGMSVIMLTLQMGRLDMTPERVLLHSVDS